MKFGVLGAEGRRIVLRHQKAAAAGKARVVGTDRLKGSR
jgi:hypothetical protein